jgi:DNA-binding PadR family transcriptional regulator
VKSDLLRRSPLALAVLGLLAGGPLHPYRMERLLKEWGKDQVVRVGQRANLYTTIKRLHNAGAVAIGYTERDQQYPERTVYEITDQGRELVHAWLAEMVSTPRNEFPEFPAALSFLMLLGPDEAASNLEERRKHLRTAITALDETLAEHGPLLPRVTLLETEYQRAVSVAELGWVEGVLDELRDGTLNWTEADFASAADSYRQD